MSYCTDTKARFTLSWNTVLIFEQVPLNFGLDVKLIVDFGGKRSLLITSLSLECIWLVSLLSLLFIEPIEYFFFTNLLIPDTFFIPTASFICPEDQTLSSMFSSQLKPWTRVNKCGKSLGSIPMSMQAALLNTAFGFFLHMYRACLVVLFWTLNSRGSQPWHMSVKLPHNSNDFPRWDEVVCRQSHIPELLKSSKTYGSSLSVKIAILVLAWDLALARMGRRMPLSPLFGLYP